MAAAAAAPSSACFSTTPARRHLRSLNSVLKATGAVRVPSLPDLCRFPEQLSVTGVAHRSNLTGITPAVVVVAQEHEAPAEEVRRLQYTKLYFGNLPYHCDGAQLAGVIQDYASPLSVEVLYDKDTGRSRGFAFVTMSSTEACEAVISNLNGTAGSSGPSQVDFIHSSIITLLHNLSIIQTDIACKVTFLMINKVVLHHISAQFVPLGVRRRGSCIQLLCRRDRPKLQQPGGLLPLGIVHNYRRRFKHSGSVAFANQRHANFNVPESEGRWLHSRSLNTLGSLPA